MDNFLKIIMGMAAAGIVYSVFLIYQPLNYIYRMKVPKLPEVAKLKPIIKEIPVPVVIPRTKENTSCPLTESKNRVIQFGERITGRDVRYIVPSDMNKIVVRLLHPNGRFKSEYTLTNYLTIKPKEQIQILIK